MTSKNGGRGLRADIKSFLDLLSSDDLPTFAELMDRIRNYAGELRGDDLDDSQRQLKLFGRDFEGWDEVPSAVLVDREIVCPDDLLPQSETELQAFCEKLIDRGEYFDLVNCVTRSWGLPLARFVKRLWATTRTDRRFFEAVVAGRHRSAVLYMRDEGVPQGLTPEQALALIARMGLLWCAHDVQLTAAQVRRAARLPMESFVSGKVSLMAVSAAHNIGRRLFRPMKRALDGYCTEEELAAGKKPPKSLGKAWEVLIVRRHLEDQGELPESGPLKHKLDELVIAIRAYIASDRGAWMGEVMLEKPSGRYSRTKFSHIWWSEMDGLQPLAVSILRFLQAEAQMDDLVLELAAPYLPSLHAKGTAASKRLRGEGNPADGFLPPFDETRLRWGWKTRARQLTTLYRRAIIRDCDLHSVQRARGVDDDFSDEPAHNDTFIAPAAEFLQREGARRIGDDHGDQTSTRRTFYLLDVLPDVRLCR